MKIEISENELEFLIDAIDNEIDGCDIMGDPSFVDLKAELTILLNKLKEIEMAWESHK